MEKDPFSEWDESNPCFGCPTKICCTDVKIPLEPPTSAGGSSLEELAGALYPHIANPDKPVEERNAGVAVATGSVVFCFGKRTGRWYLVIKGPCPLLLGDGRCSAHNEKRPWGCTHSGPSKLFPDIFSKCPK